jgi:cytochrome o ubiquinol oxidase subunit 2
MIPKTARRGLALLTLAALAGCNTVVMNPSGDIAKQQADLIVTSVLLMLIIVVPVLFLIVLFAWRYRKSANARYEPDWDHSTKLELVIWGAPLLIIIALGLITWISTHKLDPYRPLERLDEHRPIPASTKPLVVQVVALDWKWLFIYPQQHIATVNEVAFPVDVPVNFKVTSDSVMNSFFIPRLGSQIYAMAGMQSQVNLIANQPGTYEGLSANFSGDGFSDMKFSAKATSDAQFRDWVAQVRQAPQTLDNQRFSELSRPSERNPVEYFSKVDPMLYAAIVDRIPAVPNGTGIARNLCVHPAIAATALGAIPCSAS